MATPNGAAMGKKEDHVANEGIHVQDTGVDGIHGAHDVVSAESLHGVHGQHHAHSFTSLLGGDRKRESDSDIHDEEENDEEDDHDEDPARMMTIPEDDASFVQCPPIEQSFESWEEFHHAMEEYCIATHQPMRLRTSDSAKAVNSRAAKRNSLKEPIDETVGFVKKLYLCTHGVKTKPRGKGKRPRQHYRYMGCPAMIRACISERKPSEGAALKSKYAVRVVAQVREISLYQLVSARLTPAVFLVCE
jgi:hypothetical protein